MSNRRSHTLFAPLALTIGVLIALAGCGGDGEDPQALADVTRAQKALSTSDIDVAAGGASDLASDKDAAVSVPAPPAAPISGPASRQEAQSVGGVESEDAPEEIEPVSQTITAEREPVVDLGPVIDIPVYPGPSTNGAGETADPAAELVTSEPPAPDRPADSCGDNCEIGGLDIEPEPELLDEVDALLAEEGVPANADDECPQGSAPGCAPIVIEPTSVDESADADDRFNCELRPWASGCAGPIPAPSDYEPQPTIDLDPGPTGVEVPQEIQDVLLSD